MQEKFVKVNSTNLELIDQFLDHAGSSLVSFRYFNKRPKEIVEQHLCTYMLMHDEKPVGYGHLDIEDNKVWLGIAVIESMKGRGLGNKIMNKLIEEAKASDVSRIHLSVDNTNKGAMSLYEKFGFRVERAASEHTFYILDLK